MSSLLAAGLPSNYTTAAELTLAIPLSMLMIVLGWWVWWSRTKAKRLESIGRGGPVTEPEPAPQPDEQR